MFRVRAKKGIVLFIVLGMVLMVAVLAQVILKLILSHNKLTHHQTSRIQAYYAAMAGTNYALDQLRRGAWSYNPGPPITNSCRNIDPPECTVPNSDFPPSIREIGVIFCAPNPNSVAPACGPCQPPVGNDFCVQTKVDYTNIQP